MSITSTASKDRLYSMMEWLEDHLSRHGIIRRANLIAETFTCKTRADSTPVSDDVSSKVLLGDFEPKNNL